MRSVAAVGRKGGQSRSWLGQPENVDAPPGELVIEP